MEQRLQVSPAQSIAARPERPLLTFRILGTLQVLREDHPCTPTAPKQRVLLGLLLIRANDLVTRDSIVDELWRDDPPRTAVAALQMHLSALRRILCPDPEHSSQKSRSHPVIRTVPAGYTLHVATEKLDHVCFRSLAARARRVMSEGRFDDCAELFRSALAQWRGPVLADVDTTPALGRYALRLEEERLRCLEHRLSAELCLGLHFDVVDELEELAARCPFREVFHVQLMLALHRCGRRADALRAYQSVHRAMVDQLGITPGPTLRAAQRAILEGREPPVQPHG